MALRLFQLPLPSSLPPSSSSFSSSFSSSSSSSSSSSVIDHAVCCSFYKPNVSSFARNPRRRGGNHGLVSFVGKEDTQLNLSSSTNVDPPTAEDLQYVLQIKNVLELLKKNRDMLFGEVKLTVMIEDPREVERRRFLGIEDPDAPTRDDLVTALEEVKEGKVPKNKVALRLLAEEMIQWPNLEVEVPKKQRTKSLYARSTDTGINPREAAKRLNIDWDSAAEIEDTDTSNETEVPAAVGYGALYLVTAFPVIIGVSVVLILFYNSLQ